MDIASKIIPIEKLASWREELRAANRKLVVTNGVFDLMHRGHATYLEQTAQLGDALLVLINDDASVTQLKGPSRPIQPEMDRAWLLAALQCVDGVCIFHGSQCTEALRLAAPDIYSKGGDYTPESLDRSEYAVLQECGAQIRILPLQEGCSSSNIIRRILAQRTEFGDASANDGSFNPRLECILSRRSVREFLPRAVGEEEIQGLMQAAMAAPSARAGYPAEFIVLDDPEQLAKVAQLLPNGGFLSRSPLGIIVCGDINQACRGELSYMIQDCSAAIENILIAARQLGLGACWLGIHPVAQRIDAIKQLFNLPENIIPISGIAIGWPVATPPPRTQYNPAKVHRNQF